MCCCEYQLVLSGEGCCHGDCFHSLSWNIKTIYRLIFFFLSQIVMERLWTCARMSKMCWNQMATITMETFPSPSWQILWDTGALGGAPVVYCYSAVVSEHPLWLWVCLSFCVSVIPCSALCSLAEDEVKTEADVVEGMDASVRSKGKSLRPSSSH